MEAHLSQEIERCLAIDLHKHYLVVGGVNRAQEVVLSPRRMGFEEWARWYPGNLHATDAVVIEATTNAWYLHDQIASLVGLAVVANPIKIALIGKSRVKTDKKDVQRLAKLLAANLMPIVWVPPPAVRELRALGAHRRRLVKDRTRLRNRLQSVLHSHNLKRPAQGSLFGPENRNWWERQALPISEKLSVAHDLSLLDNLAPHVRHVEAELARLSTQPRWAPSATRLLQLPGFGTILTMTVLAAIGDVERFAEAKKLVGYAGLGSSVHASGEKHRTGRITKSGRRELRWALVEAARQAARTHPYWKAEFTRLEKRIGQEKAWVAIARKLLVSIWHILTKGEADRHTRPARLAYKLYARSYDLRPEHFEAMGLTRRQYIRYQLMLLGVGDDLTHAPWSRGIRRSLAPVEEVRALRPELASG